jgi:hypothetical protein
LWDVASGQPVGEPLRSGGAITAEPTFSADGLLLLTSSELWDLTTRQLVQSFETQAGPAAAFSPDGRQIAVVDSTSLHLLSVETLKLSPPPVPSPPTITDRIPSPVADGPRPAPLKGVAVMRVALEGATNDDLGVVWARLRQWTAEHSGLPVVPVSQEKASRIAGRCPDQTISCLARAGRAAGAAKAMYAVIDDEPDGARMTLTLVDVADARVDGNADFSFSTTSSTEAEVGLKQAIRKLFRRSPLAATELLALGTKAYREWEYEVVIDVLYPLLYPQARLRSEEQRVQSHRMLAVAYEAQNQKDLAMREMRALLELRSNYQLDPTQTSPEEIALFNEVLRRAREDKASQPSVSVTLGPTPASERLGTARPAATVDPAPKPVPPSLSQSQQARLNEAALLVWKKVYGRRDKVPAIRVRDGRDPECVVQGTGRPGMRTPQGCREGLALAGEVAIVWQQDQPWSETALAHELYHAVQFRLNILDPDHRTEGFRPLQECPEMVGTCGIVERANQTLRAAGF